MRIRAIREAMGVVLYRARRRGPHFAVPTRAGWPDQASWGKPAHARTLN